jgi:uncharacterized protein YegL
MWLVRWWLSRPATVEASNGLLSRTVPSIVVERGASFSPTLNLWPDALPTCTPNSSGSVDVVLVLDFSGSMQGQALQEATPAVRAFIQAFDFSRNRAGLVLFDDDAVVATPLTNNPTELENGLTVPLSGGGTAIHAGLRVAQEQLQEAPLDQRRLIVLWSDGGSDLHLAQEAGEATRADGIELIAVAVQGDSFQPDVLEAATGSASRVIPLSRATDLPAVFTNLGMTISRNVGSNLSLSEQINLDAFRIVSADTFRASDSGNAILEWHSPFLPLTEQGVGYTLEAQEYGLHSITLPSSTGSLTKCDGTTLTFESPQGPSILVTPPLAWFGLPWLLILGVFMTSWLRNLVGRRREPEGPLPLDPGTRYPPFIPDYPGLPLGLFEVHAANDLDKLDQPARGEASAVDSHLILAVGPQGRWVLTELKRRLIERYGRLPEKIALLLIDFAAPKRSSSPLSIQGVELDAASEIIVLEPNLDQIVSNLHRGVNKELAPWWGKRRSSEPSRARARLALAANIGIGSIKVAGMAQQLTSRKRALGEHTLVGIGFLGDEAGSGMIYDLMELARVIEPDVEAPLKVLLLGMPDVVTTTRRNDEEQTKWMGAALYEYERLKFSNQVPWRSVYGPSSGAPFDICYLFSGTLANLEDTRLDKPSERALADQNPAAGALTAVVEWLDTLLDPNSTRSMQQRIVDEASTIDTLIGQLQEPLIGAIGAAEIQIPVEELTALAEAKFLTRLLQIGVSPAMPVESENNLVVPFMRGDFTGGRTHPFLSDLLEWKRFITENDFTNDYFIQAVDLTGDVLVFMLKSYAIAQLGTSPEPTGVVLTRLALLSGSLIHYLSALLASESTRTLPQSEQQAIGGWIERQTTQLSVLRSNVQSWQELFEGLQQRAKEAEHVAEERWQAFLESRTGTTTSNALLAARGTFDLAILRASVENEVEESARQVLQKRVFWVWPQDLSGGVLVLPALDDTGEQLRGLSEATVLRQHGFTPEHKEALAHRLNQWARYYAAFVKHSTRYYIADYLARNPRSDSHEASAALKQLVAIESNVLLKYDKNAAEALLNPGQGRRGQSAITFRNYQHQDETLAENIARGITTEDRFQLGTTTDPFRFNVALTVSPIPLGTIDQYREVTERNLVRSSEQIFTAEFTARLWAEHLRATWDNDALDLRFDTQGNNRTDLPSYSESFTFRTQFRYMLAADPERAELFARALLLDVLHLETNQLVFKVGSQPVQPIGAAQDWLTALILFASRDSAAYPSGHLLASGRLSGTIREIEGELTQCKNQIADLQIVLRKRLERDDLWAFAMSAQPLEQDFWLFLLAVAGYELTR